MSRDLLSELGFLGFLGFASSSPSPQPSPIEGEGICGFTLTLGPPLNLPLGGGGRWLEGEGD